MLVHACACVHAHLCVKNVCTKMDSQAVLAVAHRVVQTGATGGCCCEHAYLILGVHRSVP